MKKKLLYPVIIIVLFLFSFKASASTISYIGSPYTYTYNTAISSLTPSITYSGGASSVTSYSVAPALTAGIALNTFNGVISGTPTAVLLIQTSYVITAHYNNGTTANVTIKITVNKATLTITGLSANNKPYDRTTTASLTGAATLSGIAGGDVVTLGGLPAAVFASANVGTGIAVTVSGYTLGGANAGNYTLTQPTGLTANIIAKTLTVSLAVASDKVYDGTTAATITGGVLAGIISPDVVSVSTSGTFASPNVGAGIVVSVALTGANAGNYTLTQPGITANITAAPLTITAGISKVYGTLLTGGPGSTAFTPTGLKNGETIGSVTATYGTGSAITDPVGTNPGTATATAATGGTFIASNYSISYVAGNITVTPKTLTITGLSGVNKIYDGTTAATLSGTAILNGVVGGDVVTLGGVPLAVFASKNAGAGISVIISGYTIGGANAGNYTLTQPAGVTANITAFALTITSAAASNKVYDGTTTATITGTLSGVIGGDVVTLIGAGTFASINAGTGIAVTSTSTLGGANAGNYTLTQPLGLTANITPLALTITGLTVSNKTYDGTTTASISGSGALSGVIAADLANVSLSGAPSAVFASKNVANGIAVTVSGYTVTGSASGNYTVTQSAGLTANISAATLTIAATGPPKVALTAQANLSGAGSAGYFNYFGTAPGETIASVTLTLSNTGSQSAGAAYTVTPSLPIGAGGFLAGNYTISYTAYNGIVAGHDYTWTGGANTTAWATTANWSSFPTGGTYPANGGVTYDGVIIPSGTTFAPTLSAGITINTLTFTGNNTLSIASGNNLIVSNAFTVNSSATAANLSFLGASTSTKVELSSSILTNFGGFNVSGTGLIQIDNTGSYIYNSGTFTANGNATLYLQGGSNNTHALTNAGTFYAGTANSNCNIEMDDYGSIENSGSFYLGPTSLMYYYNDNAQYVIVNNESGGTFTLQSNANGSAAVGEIPQGKNDAFTGIFNIERYFQGSTTIAAGRYVERNYRIISSCVNTGTQVNGNYVFGLNYIVGSTAGQTTTANSTVNAFITGCTGCSTSAGNPSIYLYNESYTPANATFTDGNFLGITNITNSTTGGTVSASDGGTYSLPVGTGVFFFFRGAATNWATRTASPFIAPDNVTFTSTGNMNVGPYTFKDWYTPASSNLAYTGTGTGTNYVVRGFNMIGNPYPCPIDWLTAYSGATGIVRTNVGPTIWVFNPVTSQYNTYLATSATTGTATGNASRYIASGQGFVVQATNLNPSLTIDEYAKAVLNNNAVVGTGAVPAAAQLTGTNLLMGTTPLQAAVEQSLRLKMVTDSINYDDIYIGFNSSASANFSVNEDAKYLPGMNAAEGLASFSSDNVQLAINYLPLPKQIQQVIRLFVTARASGTYTIQRTDIEAIPRIYDIWLMDKYKKDSLDIRNNATYTFDITADTNSYGSNRFQLVIRQNPALAIHLLNFTATKTPAGAQSVWVTENEENYTNFTVERSTDGGATFTVLGGFISSALGSYSFLDKNPPIGIDKYRLKIEDMNGTISYSNIVTLIYGNSDGAIPSNISVYPNPASSVLNLAINQNSENQSPGFSALQKLSLTPGVTPSSGSPSYGIKIISTTGSVIKSANSSQPTWQSNISSLVPGTYIIQVVNNSDQSVIGKSTFIKL